MTPLPDYISSNRQRRINALYPKAEPKKIRVYVESTADVSFWHGILQRYEKPYQIKFNIFPYSSEKTTTGKEALKKKFSETGFELIICLDSDYDYILNNQSYKEIKQNPYVFQTYAYAMENIKCYAESLNAICIKATHNTDDIIDFSELLAEYSEIIYELFVWNVYFEYIQHTNIFTRKEFSQLTLVSGNIKIEEYQESLNTLKIKVDEKLQDLKNSFPEYQNSIIQFSSQLNRLGVTNTNTYLFIRGHEIYSTVLNFLKSVCKELEGRYIKQIKSLAETGKNSSDNIRNYTNSRLSVKELLFGNDKFIDCFLFQKITTDIENYLALFKQNTQGLNHV